MKARASSTVVRLLALALLSVGCGGTTEFETDHESVTSGAGGGPGGVAPFRVNLARPIDVAHTATRLVSTLDPLAAGAPNGQVQFYETITSDGTGRFALEADSAYDDSIPPASTWDSFKSLQDLRQSFSVRYRDFEVRDPAVFQTVWRYRELGTRVQIAGRDCRRVDVTHKQDGRGFELAVDEETNLILDQRELDAQGNLLQQITVQSIDLDPDLTNVVWHDPHPTTQFALDADLDGAVGFDVEVPSNPPAGYALSEIELSDSSVDGDALGPWLKMTFTNGVEPLFYLVSVPAGLTAPGSTGRTPGQAASTDKFFVHSIGRATAGIAELAHGTVIVAGRVSPEELGDLVNSGYPE